MYISGVLPGDEKYLDKVELKLNKDFTLGYKIVKGEKKQKQKKQKFLYVDQLTDDQFKAIKDGLNTSLYENVNDDEICNYGTQEYMDIQRQEYQENIFKPDNLGQDDIIVDFKSDVDLY